MALWDQDNVYHFLKSCMILFKKHNILTINMWKQEDQIFPLHPNWTRGTTFWCSGPDNVLQSLIKGIIEQCSTWISDVQKRYCTPRIYNQLKYKCCYLFENSISYTKQNEQRRFKLYISNTFEAKGSLWPKYLTLTNSCDMGLFLWTRLIDEAYNYKMIDIRFLCCMNWLVIRFLFCMN